MIYELIVENNEDEVFAISLVENPAIERDFLYFNKEEVKFASIDEERRLVMGPILIPDKQIIRADGEGLPYYVFFRAETIKKLAESYLKKGYQASATLEHDKKIEGITLVESWIIESRTKDKSAIYNLNLPVGTWMGTMKIDNDEVWNDYIKTGKVKGFSIEGLFEHKAVSASKEVSYLSKEIDDLSEEEAKALLNHIHSLLMPSMNMNDLEDACWDGYVAIGTKMKDGREVPNCVPLEEALEYISITSTYPGQAATGSITESTI
jgi:hypothetical protein